MLLAIDVGNTQTVVGLYDGELLADHWRTPASARRPPTSWRSSCRACWRCAAAGSRDVTATVASSGVPQLAEALRQTARDALRPRGAAWSGRGRRAPGSSCGSTTRTRWVPTASPTPSPRLRSQPGPLVVVDFGTAINFDAVSADGAFLGGAIAPGLEVATNALGERAAALFGIELRAPERAIGRNTAENMQSGAIFGYAGLVDGLVGGSPPSWAANVGRDRDRRPGRRRRAALPDDRPGRAVADAGGAAPDLGAATSSSQDDRRPSSRGVVRQAAAWCRAPCRARCRAQCQGRQRALRSRHGSGAAPAPVMTGSPLTLCSMRRTRSYCPA